MGERVMINVNVGHYTNTNTTAICRKYLETLFNREKRWKILSISIRYRYSKNSPKRFWYDTDIPKTLQNDIDTIPIFLRPSKTILRWYRSSGNLLKRFWYDTISRIDPILPTIREYRTTLHQTQNFVTLLWTAQNIKKRYEQ